VVASWEEEEDRSRGEAVEVGGFWGGGGSGGCGVRCR
jgi:hypothetical protein